MKFLKSVRSEHSAQTDQWSIFGNVISSADPSWINLRPLRLRQSLLARLWSVLKGFLVFSWTQEVSQRVELILALNSPIETESSYWSLNVPAAMIPQGLLKLSIYLSIYLIDWNRDTPAQYDRNSHMHVSCLCSDWYHEQNPWQLCSRAKNNSTVTKHTADYMFTTMDQCGVRKEYVYSGCGGSNCLFFWLFLLWNIQMDQFKPDFH